MASPQADLEQAELEYQRHVAHVLVKGILKNIASQDAQPSCGYSAPGTPSWSSEISTKSVMGDIKLDGSNYVVEAHEAPVDEAPVVDGTVSCRRPLSL